MPRWQIFLIFFLVVGGPIIAQVIIMLLWPEQAVSHDQIQHGTLWGNG